MDWFSAFVGEILLRTIVGGSALVGLFYIWFGYYLFAVGLLLPLAGILAWMAFDVRSTSTPDLE